jgi:hypothetical protein
VQAGMVAGFRAHGLGTDAWISVIENDGARIVNP